MNAELFWDVQEAVSRFQWNTFTTTSRVKSYITCCILKTGLVSRYNRASLIQTHLG